MTNRSSEAADSGDDEVLHATRSGGGRSVDSAAVEGGETPVGVSPQPSSPAGAPDTQPTDEAPSPVQTQTIEREAPAADAEAGHTPLFGAVEAAEFQNRWTDVQVNFVEDPRRSLEDADALVGEVLQRLTDAFARERSRLEGQWQSGADVSTEDLRLLLQRYRSFFGRLLTLQ